MFLWVPAAYSGWTSLTPPCCLSAQRPQQCAHPHVWLWPRECRWHVPTGPLGSSYVLFKFCFLLGAYFFFFLCLALLEANNLALNVDLNSENSLMSFIQSHLWKGTYKQAEEYNLGVINGVCCFSGRKFFPSPAPGFVPNMYHTARSPGLTNPALCILTAISTMRKSRLKH